MYQFALYLLKAALGAFLYIAKAVLGFMWLSIATESPFWNLLLPISRTRPKTRPKIPLLLFCCLAFYGQSVATLFGT